MADFKDLIARAAGAQASIDQAKREKADAEKAERDQIDRAGTALLEKLILPIFTQADHDLGSVGLSMTSKKSQAYGKSSNAAAHLDFPAFYAQIKSERIYNNGGGYSDPRSNWIGYASDGASIWSCSSGSHVENPRGKAESALRHDELSTNFAERFEKELKAILADRAKSRLIY